jgi:hypothetical protein
MRVLVCGGRDFSDDALLNTKLDALHAERPISLLLSGGTRGAGTLAVKWAQQRGITTVVYQADWKLGLKAGPVRNQQMLDLGKPDLVVAFPGGRGTADMMARALKAKVQVETP